MPMKRRVSEKSSIKIQPSAWAKSTSRNCSPPTTTTTTTNCNKTVHDNYNTNQVECVAGWVLVGGAVWS